MYQYTITITGALPDNKYTIYEGDLLNPVAVRQSSPIVVALPYYKATYTFLVENHQKDCGTIQTVTKAGPTTTSTTLPVTLVTTNAIVIPATTSTTKAPTTQPTVPTTVRNVYVSVFKDTCFYSNSVLFVNTNILVTGQNVVGPFELKITKSDGTIIRNWEYVQEQDSNGYFKHALPSGSNYIFYARVKADTTVINNTGNITITCDNIPTTTIPTTIISTTTIDNTFYIRSQEIIPSSNIDAYGLVLSVIQNGKTVEAPVDIIVTASIYVKDLETNQNIGFNATYTILKGSKIENATFYIKESEVLSNVCIVSIQPSSYLGNLFKALTPC